MQPCNEGNKLKRIAVVCAFKVDLGVNENR